MLNQQEELPFWKKLKKLLLLFQKLNKSNHFLVVSNPYRYGNFYTASMKRIQEKGDDYVKTERERLNSLIESKSTVEKKKAEFSRKLNVLNSFVAEVIA